MTPIRLALALAGVLALLGCGSSDPVATPQAHVSPEVDLRSITTPEGISTGAVGVYTLVRDPADPLNALLEIARTGQAQGDQYELSIRPFLLPTSLQILGSAAGPNNTTDYSLRFTHPIAMPANLTPPVSATKRVDLFVFDVNLVLTVPGNDLLFGGAVRTNLTAMESASGYRQLGPMVTTASIGIINGTNTFPYRLLTKANHTDPRGNYDAATGWIGNEYLAPRGYDVIAQGAQADTTMRIANSIATPLPIVVMAKYMDPRAGTTAVQKRSNRLPNADPTKCRYFLPQTAGDLQRIDLMTAGDLVDNASSQLAIATATVLDWDNLATVATTYPNHAAITQVAEQSKPTQIEVSIPQLKTSGTFAGTLGASSGVINEFVTLSTAVNNVDQSFTVSDPAGVAVRGLLRVKDTQDFTNPAEFILNETLVPQALPPGFEPSTRYQLVTVTVKPGTIAPNITAVTPLTGITGTVANFSAANAGGAPTSWSWNFGGGAVPNTSTLAAPSVTLAGPGSYSATVTATNAIGSSPFNFTLQVSDGIPVINAVSPASGFALRDVTFSATASNAPTNWSWNFGGGAVPNVSNAASPVGTFAIAGNYNGTVTASNSYGSSAPFPFTLTVTNKLVGLRVRVFTSAGALPNKKLLGLANWDLAGMQAWVTTKLNPVYANSGIQFDTAALDYATIEDPAMFNIDNAGERSQLLTNYVFTQSSDKLNCFFINTIPWNPQLGGEMQDIGCNMNNSNRGCYIIPQGDAYDNMLTPHELGHVVSLPHIRTSTVPLTALNFNLMSYGTTNTTLSSNIVTEAGGWCYLFPITAGSAMNQHDVINDWTWAQLP